MDSSITNMDQISKIVLNYYNWDIEKEKILFKNEKNIQENNKQYFLIDEKYMNYLKKYINYEKLKKKIENEKLENSSVNIEEIIEKNIMEDPIDISYLESEEPQIKDNIPSVDIINDLLKNQYFSFEIINKEVKDSLPFYYQESTYEIQRNDIKEKLIFKIVNKKYKLILLIFPYDNNYIGRLFFILKLKDSNIEYLKEILEEKNISEILNLFDIELDYMNCNGYEEYKGKLGSGKNQFQCIIIANKKKYIKHNWDKIITTVVLRNNYNYEKNKGNIKHFLECLDLSNYKYNKALNSQEIRSNYTPCKIINKKWIEDFINLEKEKNKNKKFKELIQNFKNVSQEDIENNEFYIIDEICFVSLYPLIVQLEQHKDEYLDYQIYLNKNNKGAIIIKEDIYIFQTRNDINKRYFYEKIQNVNKYKYLYDMAINPDYELTEENWKELKNSNKKNEQSRNKLNEEKRSSPLMSEDEFNILLDSLNKRGKELEQIEENLRKREMELNKKLTEINNNKKVILNKKIPTIGLQNLGATCYMNAVLQCIAHFHEISEEILTWYKYSNDPNKKNKKLSYEFAEVLNNLYIEHLNQNRNQNNNIYNYKSNNKSYAPSKFKQIVGELNPLFRGIQANDSKDMMNFIIEKMHDELNPLRPNNIKNKDEYILDQTNLLQTFNFFKTEFAINFHSVLSDYLYGVQKSITLCCNCNTMIYNFQTFNFLIFPLLDVKNYILMNNFQNPFFVMQNYVLNLIDCFKYFQKIDAFTGPNQIFCNRCRCLRNANYCTLLYNVPTILCLVLNRGKDNKDFLENINFGSRLDLTDFLQDKDDFGLYYLIGVVVHVGDSSMSGHFFAYCRSHFTSPWYKYNDSIVTLSNEKEIYSVGKPYILFYHKYQ